MLCKLRGGGQGSLKALLWGIAGITFISAAFLFFEQDDVLTVAVSGDSQSLISGGMPPESYKLAHGHAWPDLLQLRLGPEYRVVNWSASGKASIHVLDGDPYDPENPNSAVRYVEPETGTRWNLPPLDKILKLVKPHIYCILIGTNDQDVQVYERHMRKIIEKAQSSGARVILITLPPAANTIIQASFPMYARNRDLLAEMNDVIFALSGEFQTGIVDFHSAVSAIPGWLNQGSVEDIGIVMDGVHIAEEGRRMLADKVAAVIKYPD